MSAVTTVLKLGVFAYRGVRVYQAGQDIYEELNKEEPNKTDIAAKAIFLGLQALDIGCQYNPSFVAPKAAMAINVGASVSDVVLNEKKTIEQLFNLAAKKDLLELATSKQFLDLLAIALFRAGNCTSRAAALELVSDQANAIKIAEFFQDSGVLLAERKNIKNIMVAFQFILEKIMSLGSEANQSQRNGNIESRVRESEEKKRPNHEAPNTNRQASQQSPLRDFSSPISYETLLAADEEFKKWLRTQKGGMAYFCPVTEELMLHPVQCNKEANLFVDKSALTQTSIQIGGEDYKRGDFAPQEDLDKRKTILKELGERRDRLTDETEAKLKVDLDAFYERLNHWEELEEIPEEIGDLCDTTHWLKCAATGNLIRWVVVPKNQLEEGDINKPLICYEKSHIERLLTLDPPTAPPKWPVNYPFTQENVKHDFSLQRL